MKLYQRLINYIIYSIKKNKIIWISPSKIEGVEKRGEIDFHNHGLNKSEYEEAAIWIEKLKTMQEEEIRKEDYEKIAPMKKAIEIFYKDPVRVIWKSDHFELGDQGRHRVKAAKNKMCKAIPVLLVEVRL
mgnify:CR=1 FL=1